VLELAVAAFGPDEGPSVFFETTDDLLDLSYPLIFSRAKMQLEVGASLRRLSYDES
jgi:hypothetical protein